MPSNSNFNTLVTAAVATGVIAAGIGEVTKPRTIPEEVAQTIALVALNGETVVPENIQKCPVGTYVSEETEIDSPSFQQFPGEFTATAYYPVTIEDTDTTVVCGPDQHNTGVVLEPLNGN